MDNKDILVVQLKLHTDDATYNKIYADIFKQMQHGLVLLPYTMEAFPIKDDSKLEIKKMEEIKNEKETCDDGSGTGYDI